ncbi:hypothetical protein FIBSPDRAFT_394129 [Athelia psychrophila]|uniref:Uncharacterized protein n=1 Tax=Athelia psychrophila TaxID=1759441 RepID=A0A166NLZ9_9AGAM|nr:hypothetical protein FIBSPDRAFT_394129 [Fibularhizoctonia sp. CBS 109695]
MKSASSLSRFSLSIRAFVSFCFFVLSFGARLSPAGSLRGLNSIAGLASALPSSVADGSCDFPKPAASTASRAGPSLSFFFRINLESLGAPKPPSSSSN